MTKAKKEDKKDEEIVNLKNQLARALADYDNLRKRTQEERENTKRVVNSVTIARLIEIWDSLVKLGEHLKDQGLDIVIKNYREMIGDLGGEEINLSEGNDFDPAYAEVVEVIETDKKELENKIAGVISAGWRLKDESFVILPTKVKVFKLKEGKKEDNLVN